MKKFKSIAAVFAALLLVVSLSGCGANKNVQGTLEEIMDKVYADIPENERPMMLENKKVTTENVADFLGIEDIEFEEALASEPGVSSIAHSVVLVRVKNGANIEAIKEKIEENAPVGKWLCAHHEDVEVESKGNLIVLVISTEATTEKIINTFKNLK